MFRSLFLSSVLISLTCTPTFAGGMSATSGKTSRSGSSATMGNSAPINQGGFSSGATTSPYRYQSAPSLRLLLQSKLGYSVYSDGKTLIVRGLTQDIIFRHQINLANFAQRLLANYPGHQSVRGL